MEALRGARAGDGMVTIRARGGKALALLGVVGIGTGAGTWAAMQLGVVGPVAGGIGGALSYGLAWLVARIFWPACLTK